MRFDDALRQQFAGAFTIIVVFLGALWAIGLIRPF
jgi:hypothetical protein